VTATEVLAELYSLPETEVERWPANVAAVLYRNAIRRGWLMPEIKENR
jgi:hypothetical protein